MERPRFECPILQIDDVEFVLEGERTALGRSRSCDIRVDEETVSRSHAVFVRTADAITVEDVRSSNGTWVNDKRISGPKVLNPGDTLAFGRVRAVLVDGSLDDATGGEASPRSGGRSTAGRIPGPPAGPFRRGLAILLDAVLLTLGSSIPFLPLLVLLLGERYEALRLTLPSDPGVTIVIIAGCGALWLVFAWAFVIHGWARRGGTPGHRLLGLCLLDWRHDAPIGYVRAWLRFAALIVTLATLGLGFLLIFVRPDRKALHDVLAGTLVVRQLA